MTDIDAHDLLKQSPEVLDVLLRDQTMSMMSGQPANIIWATDDYASLGEGYRFADPITVAAITGEQRDVIRPRALKSRDVQQQRKLAKAEVFTPSWLCNKQCNLVDDAWFDRTGVFNTEIDNPDGTHTWEPTTGKIAFPEGKTWQDYVRTNRCEITCGEAPYLVCRYDAVTGDPIPLGRRIGLLDRKLRVVDENTTTPSEWLEAARQAFESSYGYEWQGDSILLARQNLLLTYIDYYHARFGESPKADLLLGIAEVVSWNIWQMDGLKFVIPKSCERKIDDRASDAEFVTKEKECKGCKKGKPDAHVGVYCRIKDWSNGEVLSFLSLMIKNGNWR